MAQFPTMCWLCTTPTPSAACQRAPSPARAYAAIEAALNPDQEYLDEGYFFFVTGHPDTDVAGQYFYAKTADEHYQNCVKAGWAS